LARIIKNWTTKRHSSFIFCQAAIKTHSPIKTRESHLVSVHYVIFRHFGLCAPINLCAKVKSFYCQFKERFTVEFYCPCTLAAVVCFVALPIQQCSLRCLGPSEFFRVLIKRSTVDTKEKIKQTNMQTAVRVAALVSPKAAFATLSLLASFMNATKQCGVFY